MPGTVGNSRRNQLIGPGLSQWDMTLMKNTKITERLNMEIRWEVYNILNRGNFYYFPDNTFGASFGTVTKTSDVAVGQSGHRARRTKEHEFLVEIHF